MMSEKVVILSDVHGRFDVLRRVYDLEKPDVMVCLGDLANQEHGERRLDVGSYPNKDEMPPCKFSWILGNHENLQSYESVGDAVGFFGVRNVAGMKAVFLGGIGGKNREVHWGRNGALEKLSKLDNAFFLFSHEACSPFPSVKRHGADVGNKDLAAACAALKPKYHFSGHHHHSDYAYFNGVKHYRLPYAWQGYVVFENGVAQAKAMEQDHVRHID